MNEGDQNWWCGVYRADETGVIPPDELLLIQKSISESQFNQEFLCSFNASDDNILITIDLVSKAAAREMRPEDILSETKILGIDVARMGGDKCVILRRQGQQVFEPKVYQKIDNMEFAARVALEIQDFNPDAVFIDGGRGEGVIDRLRQLGFDVTEVNGAGRAIDDKHYENKRAEMWDNMRIWLENGGCIPKNTLLKSDLVAPTYFLNKRDKFQLESKEDIKKRLGRSPDIGDALALTHAFPVAARQNNPYHGRLHFAEAGYNPIARQQDRRNFSNANYNPIAKRRR